MKPKRAKNIDNKVVEAVVQVLDGWTGKLTWDLLITAIAERMGCTYTRQALHRQSRIFEAFKLRKQLLSRSRPTAERTPESLSVAEVNALMQRCGRLEGENTRLRAENERLLLQFVVWAYNAHTRGLDEDFLNRPLPSIDREVTRIKDISSKS